MKDSLAFSDYMSLAKWLSNRVGPYVEGSAGHVRPRKRTQEQGFYPEDMQLPEEEQKLLWNEFYANKETT